MICDRCGDDTGSHILSFFNMDDICNPCQEKEAAHPDYEKAKKAEVKALSDFARRGRPMNFEGIGLPDELVVAAK